MIKVTANNYNMIAPTLPDALQMNSVVTSITKCTVVILKSKISRF